MTTDVSCSTKGAFTKTADIVIAVTIAVAVLDPLATIPNDQYGQIARYPIYSGLSPEDWQF